jgi:type IX secretion system substrate protein
MKNIYLLFIALFIFYDAHPQTASRVIAFAMYGPDTTLPCTDTGGYKYSNGRGGEIFSSPLPDFECNFPFSFVYTYDFETGHNGLTKCDSSWELSKTDTDVSTQFFDEKNNIIRSSCLKYANGIWSQYLIRVYNYDTGNNLIQQIDTLWQFGRWVNINLYTYAYDQKNKVLDAVYLSKSWSDTSWSLGHRTAYIYDSSGNFISYKSLGWVEKTSSWDDPDSSNGGVFYKGNLPDSFINYTYVYHYYLTPASTDPGNYYFSPAHDTIAANYYGQNNNDWINYLRRTATYDSHQNKTAISQEVLDTAVTWISSYRTEWSYNASNQVTCERNFTTDSSGNWVFIGLTRFYYETYTPEVPYSINTMTIFPSPAKKSITIKLEWDKPEPFSITIFDAAGRLVMQWNEPATQEYKKTVSLPNQASGNYFIRAVSGKQKMVKQFVVIN